ncbi:MAG: transposase [bacterium]|nr:transposase [bacterium]
MQNSFLPNITLGRSLIDKIARRSGWLRRTVPGRALSPKIFVQAIVASVACGQRSLKALAVEVGLLSGKTISKQGLSKRINSKAVKFLKQVTARALKDVSFSAQQLSGQIDGVRRILAGDTLTKRVQLGADDRFECWLVIIRVPEGIGEERRRRLNDDAKRRGKKPHRKPYLALQDWMVFVTNLDEEQAGNLQLHELYQLRWRIENISKLSKSHTALLKLAGHRTNKLHAEALIWAWLLMMITLSGQGIFRLCGAGGQEIIGVSVFKSIEKIVQWFAVSIELACAGNIATLMERLSSQQAYHDRFERRRRISIPQRLARALESEPGLLLG